KVIPSGATTRAGIIPRFECASHFGAAKITNADGRRAGAATERGSSGDEAGHATLGEAAKRASAHAAHGTWIPRGATVSVLRRSHRVAVPLGVAREGGSARERAEPELFALKP